MKKGGCRFPVTTMRQRIAVPFEYPVHFCRHLFQPENPLLARVLDRGGTGRRPRVMVFVDSGLLRMRPEICRQVAAYVRSRRLCLALSPVVVRGGEGSKEGLRTVAQVIRRLAAGRLDRHSYVVVIGGGATLDTVGLAAALVHRGLRLVRVPTTVTAQNDVGVGVKTGVDGYGAKNFLGVFAPPFAVLNDFDFLPLLSDTDWRAGIAEALKVAIIKDRSFFAFLSAHAEELRDRGEKAMERLVRRCAALHLDHIRRSGDPFEFGPARPLDFGHWSAHRLEILSRYRVRHGQAVAIGMALDSCYARRAGLLTDGEYQAILEVLGRSGLPVWHPVLEQRDGNGRLEILRGLEQFREHLGGELTITLPRGLGACCEVHTMDIARIGACIRELGLQGRGTHAP